MSTISRREFLESAAKKSTAATAAASALGAAVHAFANVQMKPAPSDRIRVGVIAVGGRGEGNLNTFLRIPEVDCPAVVEVDAARLAKGVKIVSAARGQTPDGYKDFRRVLDRKDIDAILISTPDHWHALMTILGCQAGKDVYVEKPLATTIAEGRAMVQVARKHNRIVQVGTQQRSSDHFQEAVAFVQSGQLGRIRMIRAWAYLDWKGDIGNPPDEQPPPELDYDMWLGPAPNRPYNRMRVHHNFRWVWDYSGGLMTDWGAHMIDVVMWAMATQPTGAMAIGGKFGFPNDIRETPDTAQEVIEFPGFSVVWEHMIGCGVGPWRREHGCEFHGENGILIVDRGGWEVVSETDRLKQPERVKRMADVPRKPSSGEMDLPHVRNFLECMKTRQMPVADVETGHRSVTAPHLGNIAVRLRRYVQWDPVAEKIVGDSQAQSLVGRKYRKPWSLPKA